MRAQVDDWSELRPGDIIDVHNAGELAAGDLDPLHSRIEVWDAAEDFVAIKTWFTPLHRGSASRPTFVIFRHIP